MKESLFIKIVEDHFFLSNHGQENVYEELTLEDLFDSDKATPFLKEYGKQMKALKPKVSATYFCSMFGITCSAYLAMIGLHQSIVPMSLSSISAQLYRNEKYNSNLLAFRLRSKDWKTGDGNVEWRRKHISTFFTTTVSPLLRQLSDLVDIRPRELWGQILHGLEYGRKVALELATNETEKERLNQDFCWLTKEASHVLFNSLKNRLDFPTIEIENPTTPGQMQRLKPTCCLYYQTEGAQAKCYTCPRMTTREREQRKKVILELVK